ncbi:MAG: tRNA (N(6)-L-threonylcarbamoyladenosine(37)-C(2))-methylthiotransferase MtaB [Anaerolineae bacterium]|nr:tRNA (N(6)-L-threonylcarbamoyladenosine(37)-C(2))-methylthiotransferase MtaB [Anaerolineae bacterium]
MRIYVSSLGCKLNQAEMDALAGRLAQAGHQVVLSVAEADLAVLNTCAVTHVAAQKSRQALRRLHRENPEARLAVTGCYAELSPGELSDLPGVDLLVGNEAKADLVALLPPASAVEASPLRLGLETPGRPLARTRALVKIQDGCDNACTYCIIHVARGPQHSRPPDRVLAEVGARLSAGHREIVLTGVHIGAYGQDRRGEPGAQHDLWGLIGRILTETSVERLRLSSIEPWDLPERALELWRDPRLCRHLHLPLQSGCDATLQRMGRRYDTAAFAGLVRVARAAIPGLAVTSDLIVGFPGETEAYFARSLAFVEEMAFARLHVFPYSIREGTPAAGMPGQVPHQVKVGRARAMRQVAAASSRAFRQQFIGERVSVLWESCQERDGRCVWSGLTDNYLRVQAPGPPGLANTFSSVHVIGLSERGLRGRIEDQKSGG